ncbi:flagellar hook-associated protein FlgK [Clostridiaceae bacterium 35-E11]
MSGTFFGFNIARSGLFASQRAIHVTGHNIANANTPGYTRQRLEVVSSNPLALPGGQGMLGAGVDTNAIENIRDEFLDFKFRGENESFGEWNVRADVLENIEAIMNEPSDTGIRTVMDEYFASLQKLSTNADEEGLTVRALVRERAIALAKTINTMGHQLEKMQKDLDFQVNTVVSEINGYADQIAELNSQIFRFELDGSHANDLRDQRNLILDQLSERVNIDTFEDKNGKFHVLVSGKPLVSHQRVFHFATEERVKGNKKNNSDMENLLDVKWADSNSLKLKSGKLKGLLDARDNAEGSEKGIPYYMEQLNNFAKTFAAQTNMIHREGYGLKGTTGVDFFEMNGGAFHDKTTDVQSFMTANPKLSEAQAIAQLEKNGGAALGITAYEDISIIKMIENGTPKYYVTPKVTATSLAISKTIDNDLNAIAASSTHAGLPGNGDNALRMNQLKNEGTMFDWGKPEDFMKSLISNLGVDTQQAQKMAKNQSVLLEHLENKRQSISGVSIDEEMSNMIRFQHSYNANARMITTIDEMIDVIVNRMGLVGR